MPGSAERRRLRLMERATEPVSGKQNDRMKKITVLLVDDHPVVRSGLRALLSSAADLLVVGEAPDGRQAVRKALRLKPDVVLMDVAMPLLNGIEATRQILRIRPLVKVLVLSTYSDAPRVQAALEAGACAYVIKSMAGDTLLELIRRSVHGKAGLSPEIPEEPSHGFEKRGGEDGAQERPAQRLSCRESEVLQLVAEGFTSKRIGSMIGISYKTVEKHRQAVMEKLDLHRICGLTRYAVRAGIIESNRSPLPREALATLLPNKTSWR
jgi:DNA-binding NarL/FixJ family response regulator